MSEEDSKDNERENDKKPCGFLSEGFVGSNPTPRTAMLKFEGGSSRNGLSFVGYWVFGFSEDFAAIIIIFALQIGDECV